MIEQSLNRLEEAVEEQISISEKHLKALSEDTKKTLNKAIELDNEVKAASGVLLVIGLLGVVAILLGYL